jgi:SAM-dependent methyltransferase
MEAQCRICGADAGRRFNANGFAWFDCKTCGTTQKILTQQQYLDLNPTYDPGNFLDSRDRGEIERFIKVADATKVISGAARKYLGTTSGRTFLDVGCGMGGYLIAAQRLGFEVLGFEPSADHARIATQCLGLPVVSAYFTRERVGGKRFDMIMLSHVIEHIFDPKTFIHELVDTLRPGGVLIVITPNNRSLVARFIGKAWPMLKPVDHVSLIGADAYKYFRLNDTADVFHSSSEYPFEFAAAALSALKSSMSSSRRQSSNQAHPAQSAAPPLRGFGVKAKLLRYGLSLISAPMHAAAVATGRQGCLTSVIVRRAS